MAWGGPGVLATVTASSCSRRTSGTGCRQGICVGRCWAWSRRWICRCSSPGMASTGLRATRRGAPWPSDRAPWLHGHRGRPAGNNARRSAGDRHVGTRRLPRRTRSAAVARDTASADLSTGAPAGPTGDGRQRARSDHRVDTVHRDQVGAQRVAPPAGHRRPARVPGCAGQALSTSTWARRFRVDCGSRRGSRPKGCPVTYLQADNVWPIFWVATPLCQNTVAATRRGHCPGLRSRGRASVVTDRQRPVRWRVRGAEEEAR